MFEMRDDGLVEVLDASARFVAEATRAPGSVVLCAMEGSRPLLVEVQALVSSSELVPPRRVVAGLDRNRSRSSWRCSDDMPASASAPPTCSSTSSAACGSTSRGRPRGRAGRRLGGAPDALDRPRGLPLACFGEVGLTGELRTVAHGDRRLHEARRFGLEPVIEPANANTLRAAITAALAPAGEQVAAQEVRAQEAAAEPLTRRIARLGPPEALRAPRPQ